MSQRAVTVKDIANHLHVSLSTVNKALTGKPGISEKRREEILETARDMGYTVNHTAQALSRRPKRIGIVFPSIWHSFWDDVKRGMEEEFQKLEQFQVTGIFRFTANAEQTEAAIDGLIEEKVDLLLLCSAAFSLRQACCEKINACGIPVFLLGSRFDGIKSQCCIAVDGNIAGSLAADIMALKLTAGDRVAVLTGSRQIDIHLEKEYAFRQAIARSGCQLAAVYETRDDEQQVRKCVEALYRDFPDVKGIYITSASGISVFDHVRQLPRRPVIVATDVYPQLRQAVEEKLVAATIYQNQYLMGQLAIQKAYEYLLRTTSYQANDEGFDSRIFVTPKVLLGTNFTYEIQEYRTEA